MQKKYKKMEKYFQREIIEKFKYVEQLTNQKKNALI